jgi:ubiquinol-cytochrome c reductase cytochrome c subunit
MRRRWTITAVLAAGAVLLMPLAAGAAGPSKVEQGSHLYGRYCLACHGPNGSGVAQPGSEIGAGPLRNQTQQRATAPSLRGVGALAADFYLRTGYMPLRRVGAQPRRSRVLFDENQIQAITAYVASLGRGPAIPTPNPSRGEVSRGLHLFTEHCAGCHQIVAEGGYVTGAVAPSLENANDIQIAEAVRIGPYLMPRFSRQAISDRQLDSIVAYVDYARHPDDRGGWSLGHLGPVPEGLVTWFIAAVATVAFCVLIGTRLRSR